MKESKDIEKDINDSTVGKAPQLGLFAGIQASGILKTESTKSLTGGVGTSAEIKNKVSVAIKELNVDTGTGKISNEDVHEIVRLVGDELDEDQKAKMSEKIQEKIAQKREEFLEMMAPLNAFTPDGKADGSKSPKSRRKKAKKGGGSRDVGSSSDLESSMTKKGISQSKGDFGGNTQGSSFGHDKNSKNSKTKSVKAQIEAKVPLNILVELTETIIAMDPKKFFELANNKKMQTVIMNMFNQYDTMKTMAIQYPDAKFIMNNVLNELGVPKLTDTELKDVQKYFPGGDGKSIKKGEIFNLCEAA